MGQNGIMGFLPTTALQAVDQLPDPIFARETPNARIDGAAIAAVTDLYREVLPAGGAPCPTTRICATGSTHAAVS